MTHTAGWGLWATHYLVLVSLPLAIYLGYRMYGWIYGILIGSFLVGIVVMGMPHTWFVAFGYALYEGIVFLKAHRVFRWVALMLFILIVVSAPFTPLVHESTPVSWSLGWTEPHSVTREWFEIGISIMAWAPILTIAYLQIASRMLHGLGLGVKQNES